MSRRKQESKQLAAPAHTSKTNAGKDEEEEEEEDDRRRKRNGKQQSQTEGKGKEDRGGVRGVKHKEEEEEEEEEEEDRRKRNARRQTQTEKKEERGGMSGKNHKEEEEERRKRNGGRQAQREEKEEGGGMSAVKQTTLLTHHQALEDSVDLDNIWDPLEPVFDLGEQDQIQSQANNKAKMKKLLDLLVNKDDEVFDKLVNALEPDYHWLALRLQQGMEHEERRVKKVGKGVKRKVALSLLTVRISDRQKDDILDRVTSVVEKEMTRTAHRVNVPDHRAAAQLDHEHLMLEDLIHKEVDSLLYGEEVTSAKSNEDEADTLTLLKTKLEQLQGIKQCYAAFNVGKSTSSSLPWQLLEKIEEVKSKLKILQKEKQEAVGESQRLNRQQRDQQQSLSRLEQQNRSLEVESRRLESDRQWLERSLRKDQEDRRDLEKYCQRTDEDNRNLRSEIQQAHDRLSALTLRNDALDSRNTKLTRDNLKLSAANFTLRKEARNSGARILVAVRAENRRLTSDWNQMKKDVQRMEVEKRQLVIRSQKLESQNRSLREQRRKLMQEKKSSQDENRSLKTEAKRLALAKYSPLPPITESADFERRRDARDTPRSRGVTPQSSEATPRNSRSRERSADRNEDKPKSPWNKYTEDNTGEQPTDKAGGSPQRKRKEMEKEEEENEKEQDKEKEQEEDVEEEGKRKRGHKKRSSNSPKLESLEEEGRADTSPRRAAARK